MPETVKKLKVLDLFSGIPAGGFSLGLRMAGGFETVGFCEIDPYCRRVLAKHWPEVPIHDDIRTLDADAVGPVDIITGGYPCQPFSLAGQRRGAEDDRHLWPEMHRLVVECRPAWVIGENVAGHINMGLDGVLSDLEASGYACRAFVVPACAVDAPHRRDRVWIVANSDCERQQRQPRRQRKQRPKNESRPPSETVANAARLQRGRQDERSKRQRIGAGGQPVAHADATGDGRREDDQPVTRTPRGGTQAGQPAGIRAPVDADAIGAGLEIEQRQNGNDGAQFATVERSGDQWCWWQPEPNVGRVAHGISKRVDRLKGLGNAVVPPLVAQIGRAIIAADQAREAA